MKRILTIVLLASTLIAFSQEQDSVLRKSAIKVFLDGALLDLQFIKDHLTFVNYVRDHHDADVYILIVRQSSGSGGERYTLIFEGQHKFEGKNDTLAFSTPPDATSDEIRQKLLKYLKAGLMPYVANTPVFDYVDLSYNPPVKEEKKIVEDKWHSWVFDISLRGWASGESQMKSLWVGSSFSAVKVTPDWILDFELSYDLNKAQYQITEDYIYTSKTQSYYFDGEIIKSLNSHWSAAIFTETGQSSFLNLKFYSKVFPAIEFNVFPYDESTIHQLRINYRIGPVYYDYFDTTIYLKTQELLYQQKANIKYSVKKKWGSIGLAITGATFVPDLKKNSLSASISFTIRVTKGLSLNWSGSYGFVHDQVYLPKGGATLEEILTRQRQLETSFRYHTFFGISYTFGAIYNNVVNPRFGHSSGGGMMIIYM